MICDENTYEAAGKQVEALVPGLKKIVLDPDNLHANEHGVEAAKKGLDEIGDVDMMIAVGSGTVHDITRFHAYEMKIPFFSVPTAASVDGFVSTVAAMTWHGFKKSFTAVSPVVVIADTDIFKKSTTTPDSILGIRSSWKIYCISRLEDHTFVDRRIHL